MRVKVWGEGQDKPTEARGKRVVLTCAWRRLSSALLGPIPSCRFTNSSPLLLPQKGLGFTNSSLPCCHRGLQGELKKAYFDTLVAAPPPGSAEEASVQVGARPARGGGRGKVGC
eukprot:189237-Chlamydomonas_euryale.AAC.1